MTRPINHADIDRPDEDGPGYERDESGDFSFEPIPQWWIKRYTRQEPSETLDEYLDRTGYKP